MLKWSLFIGLCLIWGSSFMLMKWGMFNAAQQSTLTAYQVAALRMLSAGVIMLPFLPKAVKEVNKSVLGYIVLSGLLGSFFPAFLFCIAETKIDGALAGSLNALTPLFVAITGFLFFGIKSSVNKVAGIVIGLIGSVVLTYANYHKPIIYIAYTGFVILATLFYGINVNMVQKRLKGVSSLAIATIAFVSLIIPSLIILFFTKYFELPLTQKAYALSTLSSSILGIAGTAIASVMFYMLVKRAGGLFASLVTYGIPFVAIGWGVYYNEAVTVLQIIGLAIILTGVYVANKK